MCIPGPTWDYWKARAQRSSRDNRWYPSFIYTLPECIIARYNKYDLSFVFEHAHCISVLLFLSFREVLERKACQVHRVHQGVKGAQERMLSQGLQVYQEKRLIFFVWIFKFHP